MWNVLFFIKADDNDFYFLLVPLHSVSATCYACSAPACSFLRRIKHERTARILLRMIHLQTIRKNAPVNLALLQASNHVSQLYHLCPASPKSFALKDYSVNPCERGLVEQIFVEL